MKKYSTCVDRETQHCQVSVLPKLTCGLSAISAKIQAFQWLLEGVEINKCVQPTVLNFLATVSLVARSLSLAHSLT